MERFFNCGPATIIVEIGDILLAPADAIVNPANSLGLLGGGVAGAIARAGGPEVQREALAQAPIAVGEAVITASGNLIGNGISYVIHAATMPQPGMRIPAENARLAMLAALRCAAKNGIQRLAVPGLGTGVGGVSYRDAANKMVEALIAHYRSGVVLPESVYFVASGQEFHDAISQELARHLPEVKV
jgi:O-acetyl-ADP-ribose deacetylase (regulator of RNase III)